MYRRFLVPLLLLGLVTGAAAQRPQQLATMTVHVTMANEQPAPAQSRVQLLTGGGIPMMDATTNGRGEAEFINLPVGNYRLRISGPGIEDTTTGEFAISPFEVTHSEFVRVRPKPSAGETPYAPGGTVSVVTLKIPKNAIEEYKKGNKELKGNHWEEARQHFEAAVRIYPQFASAYNNIGVACGRLNDTAQARAAYQQAIRLDPQLATAYMNLARLEFTSRNLPAAQTLLRKYLGMQADDPEALTMLAETELLTGDYDAALADARKVRSEKFAIVHYVAGQALEAKGQESEAIAEYQAFLKEQPDSPAAPRVRAALARLRQNR